MTTLLRLDSISPTLANAFRHASDAQRRQAALATCEIATARTGLQGREVAAALHLLRHGGNNWRVVQRELESLSERFDQQYLTLNEGARITTPDALRLFRKARAATALRLALCSDPRELHEALYEAIIASDDESEAMRAADRILRTK
jgi:hypothetical protein